MKKAFGAVSTGDYSYEKNSNSDAARRVHGHCLAQCKRS